MLANVEDGQGIPRRMQKIFVDIASLVGSACTESVMSFDEGGTTVSLRHLFSTVSYSRRVKVRVPINTYVLSSRPADICRRQTTTPKPKWTGLRRQLPGDIPNQHTPFYQISDQTTKAFVAPSYIEPSREDEIRIVGCRSIALHPTTRGSILVGC